MSAKAYLRLGYELEQQGLIEEADLLYERGAKEHPESHHLAFVHAARCLARGNGEGAYAALLGVNQSGMSPAKIRSRLRRLEIAPIQFLPLFAAGAPHESEDGLATTIIRQELEGGLKAFATPGTPIPESLLSALCSASPGSRGLHAAVLAARGRVEESFQSISAAFQEEATVNPGVCVDRPTNSAVWLFKELKPVIDSGWGDALSEFVVASHRNGKISERDDAFVAGCVLLFSGRFEEGRRILNELCPEGEELAVLREHSIQEWAIDKNQPILVTGETREFWWEVSALSSEGERIISRRGMLKPSVSACVHNAHIEGGIVTSKDTVFFRDVEFNPQRAAEDLLFEAGDGHYGLFPRTVKPKIVSGEAILVGSHWNFWHFVVNHLGKLFFAVNNDSLSQARILCFEPLTPTQLEAFAAFGYPEDRVLVLDNGPYEVERLWLASIPFSNSWMSEDAYVPEVVVSSAATKITRQVLQGDNLRVGNRRVYLSRRDAIHRRIANEDAVCELLATYGFEIAEMTKLSLRAQADLVRDARIIVGAHGAQLTAAFFAPPGCHVIELVFDKLVGPVFYEFPAKVLDLGYTKLSCELVGLSRLSKTHPHPDLEVPLEPLRYAVERILGPPSP